MPIPVEQWPSDPLKPLSPRDNNRPTRSPHVHISTDLPLDRPIAARRERPRSPRPGPADAGQSPPRQAQPRLVARSRHRSARLLGGAARHRDRQRQQALPRLASRPPAARRRLRPARRLHSAVYSRGSRDRKRPRLAGHPPCRRRPLRLVGLAAHRASTGARSSPCGRSSSSSTSSAGRSALRYLRRLDRPERWVLVGDDATAERLRAYAPLRDYARSSARSRPPTTQPTRGPQSRLRARGGRPLPAPTAS